MKLRYLLKSNLLFIFLNTFSLGWENLSLENRLINYDNATRDIGPDSPCPLLWDIYNSHLAVITKKISSSPGGPNGTQPFFTLLTKNVDEHAGPLKALSLHQLIILNSIFAGVIDIIHGVRPPLNTKDFNYLAATWQAPLELDKIAHPGDDDYGMKLLLEIKFITLNGLRPYPFLSDDGLVDYRELNLSFARGVPICGIPLQSPCPYDGFFVSSSVVFYYHDLKNHALKFNDYRSSCLNSVIETRYVQNAYRELYDLVESQGGSELDHYVLFHLGHELFFRDLPALPPGKRRINLSQEDLSSVIRASSWRYRDIFHAIRQCMITSDYKIQAYSVSEPYSLEKLLLERLTVFDKPLLEKDQPWGAEVDTVLARYNQLFLFQEVLARFGIHFTIWSEDRKLQIESIVGVIEKVFKDFKNKYLPLLPIQT